MRLPEHSRDHFNHTSFTPFLANLTMKVQGPAATLTNFPQFDPDHRLGLNCPWPRVHRPASGASPASEPWPYLRTGVAAQIGHMN
jgi:hypothetical protein